jgi:hypothetical protein
MFRHGNLVPAKSALCMGNAPKASRKKVGTGFLQKTQWFPQGRPFAIGTGKPMTCPLSKVNTRLRTCRMI